MYRLAVTLSIAGLAACSTAPQEQVQTTGKPEFIVVGSHFDNTVSPKSIGDTMTECLHNPVCKEAADGVAAAFGADISDETTAATLLTHVEHREEAMWVEYPVPDGYKYCRSTIKVVSVVPATGDRASTLQVDAKPDLVHLQTWTPVLQAGEGRSWVEGDLSMVFVRADVADENRAAGKCSANDTHTVLRCRGWRGINHGEQSCGGRAFGDAS